MGEQDAKAALSISHRGFALRVGPHRFDGTRQELPGNPEVAGDPREVRFRDQKKTTAAFQASFATSVRAKRSPLCRHSTAR